MLSKAPLHSVHLIDSLHWSFAAIPVDMRIFAFMWHLSLIKPSIDLSLVPLRGWVFFPSWELLALSIVSAVFERIGLFPFKGPLYLVGRQVDRSFSAILLESLISSAMNFSPRFLQTLISSVRIEPWTAVSYRIIWVSWKDIFMTDLVGTGRWCWLLLIRKFLFNKK